MAQKPPPVAMATSTINANFNDFYELKEELGRFVFSFRRFLLFRRLCAFNQQLCCEYYTCLLSGTYEPLLRTTYHYVSPCTHFPDVEGRMCQKQKEGNHLT